MVASVLGTNIDTGNLIALEQEARLRGLYVIGKTGSGKTTLLINLILQDIEQGMGVCFFDTHGDAITEILTCLPSEREKDVILLDLLDDEYAFGLNLFQCNNPQDKQEVSRVVSTVMGVFAKLFTDTGDLLKEAPNMAETLQNAVPVLLAHKNPRMTMAEIPLLLMDETARTKLIAPVTNLYVRNFWNSYSRWKQDRQEELTGSTRRRVGNFLTDPLILEIVGQSETTLPFREIMDESKILLVKLSRQHELISSLIGSVIVGQIANAAFSRVDTHEDERVQFNLYADEYQRFSTPTFAELLAEVRKYKIATCVAHQWRAQLDQANRGATLNAANIVVYQVSGEDAEEMAKQFDATPPAPEIIGWRPILTPKSDVVDHLKKNGHVNPQVSAFVNMYLIPALRVVEINHKTVYGVRVSPRPGEPKHKLLIADLDEAIHQLNTFLFSVMREKNAEKPIPPLVFWMFAKLYGFSGGFARYITVWNPWNGHPLPSVFHPKPELFLLCAPDFLSHRDQVAQKISPYILEPALAFVTQLRQTMHILSIDPILIDTGQHEPIYDKPRTYADVQNEIAKRLAIPQQEYAARCKLGTKEYTILAEEIRTGDTDEVYVHRKERIIAQTRKLYSKKREDVIKEIAARQEMLMKPEKKQQKTKQEEE